MSGAPGPLLFFKYQVAGAWPNCPAGSKTPTVSLPSPSQSPATGTQPAAPKAKGATSGAPETLVFFRYQVAGAWPNCPAGSKTPTVSLPSPSQSPATGTQPAAP